MCPGPTVTFTTRAQRVYSEVAFAAGDAFVFGAEAAGLPEAILAEFDENARVRLPMRADPAREIPAAAERMAQLRRERTQ